MLKASPLKHTKGKDSEGHLLLNKEAHKKAHGGVIPEENDIIDTIFGIEIDAFKPRKG